MSETVEGRSRQLGLEMEWMRVGNRLMAAPGEGRQGMSVSGCQDPNFCGSVSSEGHIMLLICNCV